MIKIVANQIVIKFLVYLSIFYILFCIIFLYILKLFITNKFTLYKNRPIKI